MSKNSNKGPQKHIVIDARIRRTSTGRYTDRLLEHLQSLDLPHRFTVLVEADDPWRPRAANFDVKPAPFPQFSFNPLHDIKFSHLLRSLKPDLVHFTMTQQPFTYLGPSVTTTHDLTMLNFVRRKQTPEIIFALKKIGYRLIFWAAHKKTRAIIVPSKFVAKDLLKLYPWTKQKIYVTYESSEPPITEAAEPMSIKKPFILHVGSPFPHKNIKHLIKAFEKVRQKRPNLQLVLAGKKEYYFSELENWTKQRNCYESVHFTGFVSDAELKWLYQNAACYALPSLSEGFGLPGLEAMTHGCPLISSNYTCLPEIYGEAALYFNPKNIAETADVIEKVLSNRSLQTQLVTKGYKQIQKYSWEKMAIQTADIYAKSLAA